MGGGPAATSRRGLSPAAACLADHRLLDGLTTEGTDQQFPCEVELAHVADLVNGLVVAAIAPEVFYVLTNQLLTSTRWPGPR